MFRYRCGSIFLIAVFTFILCSSSTLLFSQNLLRGKVVYKHDALPAAFASIELKNHRSALAMTNFAGDFAINYSERDLNDTLIISSVGYESVRLPLYAALKKKEFELLEIIKNIEGVTVFNSHQVLGSMSESVGYYRSWSYDHSGGEIGRVFTLPYKKYKIDKIRFKAGNLCDTCLLKIHIRNVRDGIPGEEILNDSVSLVVGRLSLDAKIPEFDLTDIDYTFTQDELYVGIEVLGCSSSKKEYCSFSFAGTDKGQYIYKTKQESDWKTVDDYTIFLKLFLRY